MANKLQFTIEVDSKTGIAKVREFAGATEESAKRAGSGVDQLASSFRGLIATFGIGLSVQTAIKAVQLGVAAEQAKDSFELMARSAQESSDRILEAMTKATAGTIDDSNLMQKAVKAMALDMTGDQIVKLAEAARTSARIIGKDIGSTFDQIVDAVSTNMPRSLKQMGLITTEQMKLFNEAMSKGVTSVTLLDIALANAAKQQEKFGDLLETDAERVQKLNARYSDLTETIGIGLKNAIFSGYDALVKFEKVLKETATSDEPLKVVQAAYPGKKPGIPAISETVIPPALNETKWIGTGTSVAPNKSDTDNSIEAKIQAEIDKVDAMKAAEKAAKDRMDLLEKSSREEAQVREMEYAFQLEQLQEMENNRLNLLAISANEEVRMYEWAADVRAQLMRQNELEVADSEKRKQQLQERTINKAIDDAMFAANYFGQQNKAAFIAFKAIAIAQTTIETIKGAQAAFTSAAQIPYVGFILAPIAAAAAIAAGMARVSQIASMEPGGGAGVSGVGGGGAVGTYSANPYTGMPTNIPAGSDQGARQLTIIVQGDYIGEDGYVEMLAEKISKAVEDRDVRLISSDARFAQALR